MTDIYAELTPVQKAHVDALMKSVRDDARRQSANWREDAWNRISAMAGLTPEGHVAPPTHFFDGVYCSTLPSYWKNRND